MTTTAAGHTYSHKFTKTPLWSYRGPPETTTMAPPQYDGSGASAQAEVDTSALEAENPVLRSAHGAHKRPRPVE